MPADGAVVRSEGRCLCRSLLGSARLRSARCTVMLARGCREAATGPGSSNRVMTHSAGKRKHMSELGFRNFVGVDGSKGMLDLAAQSGLYQDLRLALLGTDPLPAQTGAFDLVVIIGALRAGFVPVSVIRELWQAAKPGGYVCMSRVDPKSESGEKYKLSMKRELQQMEEEGLWSPMSTGDMKKYMMDVYHNQTEDEQYLDGTMYLYRKSIS
ncbi:methyltransferase-like protein 27 [Labrus bergylta]